MHPPVVALDFETAAISRHSACALGMARIENMEIKETFYTLIRPPSRRIKFTEIHGLTWNDLADAPRFAEIWPRARNFINGAKYLLAHNAGFDRSILQGCCLAFCQSIPRQEFLCTKKGAKKALKLKSNSLASLCAYFDIELDHHNAQSDALGCGQIFINLIKLGLPVEDMLLGNKKL